MWEFSLNINNRDIANKIFSSLKPIALQNDAVVAFANENGHFSVLIGVDETKSEDMKQYLSQIITKTICTYYKSSFLDKFLSLPKQDKIGVVAFKKALLNFDKETDYYIVQKNLSFNKNLYLESFYDFKLKNLKAKWQELVALANENRDYLISSDAFIDLLKFLIENLDICEDEINVFEEGEGYKICLEDSGLEKRDACEVLNEENLVSSIIDLSPQKINLYCHVGSKASNLLEKIYDKRICVKTGAVCTNIRKK